MSIRYFPAPMLSFQFQSSDRSALSHFHILLHWLLSKTCLTCNYFQPISQKACSIHLSVGQISIENDKRFYCAKLKSVRFNAMLSQGFSGFMRAERKYGTEKNERTIHIVYGGLVVIYLPYST